MINNPLCILHSLNVNNTLDIELLNSNIYFRKLKTTSFLKKFTV